MINLYLGNVDIKVLIIAACKEWILLFETHDFRDKSIQ